jgi:hypothetical protein
MIFDAPSPCDASDVHFHCALGYSKFSADAPVCVAKDFCTLSLSVIRESTARHGYLHKQVEHFLIALGHGTTASATLLRQQAPVIPFTVTLVFTA